VLRRPVESAQYAANEYRKVLAARGITVSMSRKASCWDNAPMESANGTVKVECVYPEHYATREQARLSITEYLTYYNTERLHSSLNYVSPSEFERRWRAAVVFEQAILNMAGMLKQIADAALRPPWQRVQMFRDVPAQLLGALWQHHAEFREQASQPVVGRGPLFNETWSCPM
jgi:hypothetical protein